MGAVCRAAVCIRDISHAHAADSIVGGVFVHGIIVAADIFHVREQHTESVGRLVDVENTARTTKSSA